MAVCNAVTNPHGVSASLPLMRYFSFLRFCGNLCSFGANFRIDKLEIDGE